MNNYVFNTQLFNALPSLLHLTHDELGMAAGGTRTIFRNCIRTGNIRLNTLTEMCNALRIPISIFFVKESDHATIPDTITLADEDFQPITYQPERLKKLYGKSSDYTITLREILSSLGIPKLRWLNYTKPSQESTLGTRTWLNICNLYKLDPMMLFSDQNQWNNSTHNATIQCQLEAEQEANKKLRAQIRVLESRIRHLESMLMQKQSTQP